ncbi:hypothetical protein SNEBB_009390 [Seison nebaliae]|nr:hypothetical protein SNEBB_009390 [Seison nebaliae]
MNAKEFRVAAKNLIDIVADYLENIEERRVISNVEPGYMKALLPSEAPTEKENWQDVFDDIEKVIMPGITHWHHPNFFAFYPTANSFPGICGDILSSAIACIGFSWIASPACTELEVIVLDWLAKAISLPKCFISSEPKSEGGGIIVGTASEATLTALIVARDEAKRKYGKNASLNFVAYCSSEAHCSVKKATIIAGVQCNLVKVGDDLKLNGKLLEEAILKDKSNRLIPIFVCGTIGTTNTCAFDDLESISEISQKYEIWCHVDAAYAGSSFICAEYRYLMKGIENCDSFVFNPHKWLQVNFDCSTLWYRNVKIVERTFAIDALYLRRTDEQCKSAPDFRQWQIPLGRRFRSLKLWFVLRMMGIKHLQETIRKHINLAKLFAKEIQKTGYFQILEEPIMGLICFRSKENEETLRLVDELKKDGRIFVTPCDVQNKNYIRMSIGSTNVEECHVLNAVRVINEMFNKIKEE